VEKVPKEHLSYFCDCFFCVLLHMEGRIPSIVSYFRFEVLFVSDCVVLDTVVCMFVYIFYCAERVLIYIFGIISCHSPLGVSCSLEFLFCFFFLLQYFCVCRQQRGVRCIYIVLYTAYIVRANEFALDVYIC
jgi:hypothetical protein